MQEIDMNWIEISRDELENNLIKIKRVYGEEQKVGIMTVSYTTSPSPRD